MIVTDTSLLYALLDSSDSNHVPALSWFEAADPELITTPLVVGEVDHLARSRGNKHAVNRFRENVSSGGIQIEWWPGIVGPMALTAETYRDLGVSLADASLVALASHLATTTVATFDERHFRAMRPLSDDSAFTLLPADSPD